MDFPSVINGRQSSCRQEHWFDGEEMTASISEQFFFSCGEWCGTIRGEAESVNRQETEKRQFDWAEEHTGKYRGTWSDAMWHMVKLVVWTYFPKTSSWLRRDKERKVYMSSPSWQFCQDQCIGQKWPREVVRSVIKRKDTVKWRWRRRLREEACRRVLGWQFPWGGTTEAEADGCRWAERTQGSDLSVKAWK